MMEIIKTNENNKVNTGNTELDNRINTIYDCIKRGNKAAHEIAVNLYHISNKKLFDYVGAKSFSDFAENYFGISKSQGTRLVKIAEKFLIPSNKYDEYSNTQLIEMLSAKDEMLQYIKPTMTAAEIRKYIKGDDTKKLDTKPDDTKPDDTKPDDTKPDDTKPDDTKPDDTKPDDTKPDDTKPETVTTEFEFIPRTDTTPDTIKTANFSLFMTENGKPMLAKILNNIGLNEFTSYINAHNISIENITIKF